MHNFVDFSELSFNVTQQEAGDRFEYVALALLQNNGYLIHKTPARGADRGADIIAMAPPDRYNLPSLRWLVSCKHQSNGSIGTDQNAGLINKAFEHDCQGMLFIYTAIPSETLRNTIDSVKPKIQSAIIDPFEIERLLLEPKNLSIFRQFFPLSYSRLYREDQSHCGFCNKLIESYQPVYAVAFQEKVNITEVKVTSECCYEGFLDFCSETNQLAIGHTLRQACDNRC